MLAAERHARILAELRESGSVRVFDLVVLLGVTDVTVRRDLELLASRGLAVKVHGGATLPSNPVSARARAVGAVVPHPTYYFRRVVEGIRSAVGLARLTVAVSHYDASRERQLAEELITSGCEGLILVPSKENSWIAELPVPAVLAERRNPNVPGVSWVRSDHEAGARMGVRHLFDRGHHRIALVTRGDTQTARSVRRGYAEAAAAFGLDPKTPVLSGEDARPGPRWTPDEVAELLQRLRRSRATALLCHSDEDALVIAQHARSLGWRLPQELSIVAYDDEIAELADPPLTAVCPPKAEVGALAARTLLELIAEPGQPARRISLEPRLITRDSTAALRRTPRRTS